MDSHHEISFHETQGYGAIGALGRSRIGVNKYRYVLANKDADTYYAPIPVPFTMTQFGTSDNFNFQNVAYGQFAGTVILRPQEIMYFDFA